ncbi:hypothetical protein LSAT2_012119 [Lamellibrachia satsuma]|nr:hypothetical protein LSAT2_012119 [Lamellibrachia satsuma]
MVYDTHGSDNVHRSMLTTDRCTPMYECGVCAYHCYQPNNGHDGALKIDITSLRLHPKRQHHHVSDYCGYAARASGSILRESSCIPFPASSRNQGDIQQNPSMYDSIEDNDKHPEMTHWELRFGTVRASVGRQFEATGQSATAVTARVPVVTFNQNSCRDCLKDDWYRKRFVNNKMRIS